MVTTEDKKWNEIVKNYLVAGPSASLPKAEQQALAAALQEWTAHCITDHLVKVLEEQDRSDVQHHIQKEAWHIHHKGKDFLGAVRWQEVDVWLTNTEAGLVLAVDPKHFQSQDSLRNGLPLHKTSSKCTAFADVPFRANGH